MGNFQKLSLVLFMIVFISFVFMTQINHLTGPRKLLQDCFKALCKGFGDPEKCCEGIWKHTPMIVKLYLESFGVPELEVGHKYCLGFDTMQTMRFRLQKAI
ncbi:hypothetical protein SELMODRAFT_431477 [Selaginella moellendorffii]|uniref:Uncharacterized protein n=1 Tax=Selaginella moellendorffii TaxID=88036 RepID=D8TCS6_SELML|nr:hypothetical protein SELMODRAFT_431477 [Selaginella moellendorffii]